MRETGNVFTARGVLEAAHVLGQGCSGDEGTSARNVALCGSGGGSNPGANLASLGVGTARVAMGLALNALAAATSPTARPKPLLESAMAVRTVGGSSALDRYEDPRQRNSWLGAQSAECFAATRGNETRVTCPSSLDPRRVIPAVAEQDERAQP